MGDGQLLILKMLEASKITVDEAQRLLEAIAGLEPGEEAGLRTPGRGRRPHGPRHVHGRPAHVPHIPEMPHTPDLSHLPHIPHVPEMPHPPHLAHHGPGPHHHCRPPSPPWEGEELDEELDEGTDRDE